MTALFAWFFTAPLPALILDWLGVRLYYDGGAGFWLVSLYMLPVGLVAEPLSGHAPWATIIAIYFVLVAATAALCWYLLNKRAPAGTDTD